MTKKLYAGLDVSLEMTSVCVVDADGAVVCEARVLSDPDTISEALAGLAGEIERVGFEAGPLSQWLHTGLTAAGLPAVCIEARHAKAALVAMNRNKNDRNDALACSPDPIRLVQGGPRHVDGEPGVALAPDRAGVLREQAAGPRERDPRLLRPFGLGRVIRGDRYARTHQPVG